LDPTPAQQTFDHTIVAPQPSSSANDGLDTILLFIPSRPSLVIAWDLGSTVPLSAIPQAPGKKWD